MNKKTYQSFLQLLKDELIPAMGCKLYQICSAVPY
jgi:hypothetical protein